MLFHHALAERLGLGPTDHKCLDLLWERAPMTASELAAITGLTSGAITGVVARLERSGLLAREPHPHDRRKQVLRPTPAAVREVQRVFDALPDGAGCWRVRRPPARRHRGIPGPGGRLRLPARGTAPRRAALGRGPAAATAVDGPATTEEE